MHPVLKSARSRLERARYNDAELSVTGSTELGIAVTVSIREDKESLGGKTLVTVQAHVNTHGLRVEGYVGDAKKRIFTGHADFDQVYVLRAAPGDIAVALFDEATRASMLSFRPRIECDETGLRLIKSMDEPATSTDRVAVVTMIDLATTLGGRCATVVENANEAYLTRMGDAALDRAKALEDLGSRRRLEMASFYPIEEGGTGPMRSSSIAVVVVVVVALLVFVAIAAAVFVLVLR